MTASGRIVIAGASLAGAKAAETLRNEGFNGAIVLIGEESILPYERPPLSKDYLQGKTEVGKVFVHDERFYVDHDIDLRLSCSVKTIDAAGREVFLGSGEHLRYDTLLIATGSQPRRIGVPGADLKGVYYLRTMADSDKLRTAIGAGKRVVVIGAGWIGCEVAASARQLDTDVAMIEVGGLPLERVLGPELGRFYRDIHAENGVDLHFGVGVESIQGSESAEAVRLVDGTLVEGDVIVVGVGVTPRVELAESCGLALDNGIVTDQYLATSSPDIYAAGDVANAWHPLFDRRIRLEHWSAALNQGPVAAKNMLGIPTPYDRVPYFFSDQYEIGMEYSGFAPDWDEIVFRGDTASRKFIAFWLKDGRLVAGMNVNTWEVSKTIAKIVTSKAPVDRGALTDPTVELATLVN